MCSKIKLLFVLKLCPKLPTLKEFLLHGTATVVASVVRSVQPTIVANLSHWESTFVYNTMSFASAAAYTC